jgi:hypothetical protein
MIVGEKDGEQDIVGAMEIVGSTDGCMVGSTEGADDIVGSIDMEGSTEGANVVGL